jgi:hypothetical protein
MRKISADLLPYPKRDTEPQLTPERVSTALAAGLKGVAGHKLLDLRF